MLDIRPLLIMKDVEVLHEIDQPLERQEESSAS